jgi:hypothetical protein
MSAWSYKTAPLLQGGVLYNGATIVATAAGWKNSITGELLAPIHNFAVRNADATTLVTYTLALPANATYATGQVMTFTVTPSEPVQVIGSPSIALTLTSGGVLATYDAVNSTSTSLLFKYTVKTGDTALSGITVSNILTLTSYPGNGTDKIIDQIAGGTGVVVSPASLTYTVGSTSLVKVQGL